MYIPKNSVHLPIAGAEVIDDVQMLNVLGDVTEVVVLR
jgi:hypothetical protein